MIEIIKKKEKFLLGFLIGAFFVLNGIVFGAYLFSDSSSLTTEIIGFNPNTNVSILGIFTTATIIQSDGLSNISQTQEKTYIISNNMTLKFTPSVSVVLLDNQCSDYVNDCSLRWYMKDDLLPNHIFWFNTTQFFTNAFVMGKGENKIGYELQCVPTSCHQEYSISYTLSE